MRVQANRVCDAISVLLFCFVLFFRWGFILCLVLCLPFLGHVKNALLVYMCGGGGRLPSSGSSC